MVLVNPCHDDDEGKKKQKDEGTAHTNESKVVKVVGSRGVPNDDDGDDDDDEDDDDDDGRGVCMTP